MKILLLADFSCPHTIRWANSLSQQGIEVFIVSLHDSTFDFKNAKFKYLTIGFSNKYRDKPDGSLSKLFYLKALLKIKKIIREIKPDILHAHYATSYGLLGAITNFHPFIISVWGSDVRNFPKKSKLHKLIFSYILSRADALFATSKFLAQSTNQYTSKIVNVIPFGIDTSLFKPQEKLPQFKSADFIIGCVKSLESVYGIETLIQAFAKLTIKFPSLILKLLILGRGSKEFEFKHLASELDISDKVIFQGFIKPEEVCQYHNSIDIAVYPSIYEGFGVAIAESMACGKSVIASNVGGIPEIIDSGVNGILVSPNNVMEIVSNLEKLIIDNDLRNKIASNARNKILDSFDWNDSVTQMINWYNRLSSLKLQ